MSNKTKDQEIDFNCPIKNCMFYEDGCGYDNFRDCPTYLMCNARDNMKLNDSDEAFYDWDAERDIMRRDDF